MDFSTSERRYRGSVNYEMIISQQINRIADSRAKDTRVYEDNVDTLCYMLPKKLRDKAIEYKKNNNVIRDMTDDGKQRYDEFLVFINELLELEANMIFKITTWELGTD